MTSDMSRRRGTAAASKPGAEEPEEPSLDRAIQSRIGDQLRAMYDNLMEQPIPDRFSELLGQLEKGEDGPR